MKKLKLNLSITRAVVPEEDLNNPSELSLLWGEIESVLNPTAT